MIADRQAMLEGQRTRACNHGCYRYEDQGLVSARSRASKEKITDIYNPLETLKISLSNDCNLTCVYCSSESSTAWSRDIDKNGEYNIDGYKNENDNWVKLWNKIKQKNRSTESKFFKLLLKEISLSEGIKNITILGGEPLLNNGLIELLNTIKDKKINITSGLGIKKNKFKNIIDQIENKKNISFTLSAESTGSIFEFMRYGSTWKEFLNNLEHLKKSGIKINFLSTITNLTSFDILNFYEMFEEKHDIYYNPVTDRSFLQPNVLDDRSKELLINSIDDRLDNLFFSRLKQSISQKYDYKEKNKLSIFLKEFSKRRNLKLDIFPEHFLKWLGIV